MTVRATAVAAVIVVLLGGSLAGCGNRHQVNAGDPTTSGVGGSERQPECGATEPDPIDYNAEHTRIETEQAELQPDMDVIRKYGEAHSDEFTSAAMDNYPDVRAIGYFTGSLDQHRAALQAMVPHPKRVEVRPGALSAREGAAIAEGITGSPEFQGRFDSVGSGTATGVVTADFLSTAAGRKAAERAHEQWGTKVCLTIASHPYPQGAWTVAGCEAGQYAAPKDRVRDVSFTLTLDTSTLPRGARGQATGHVTNHGSTPIDSSGGSSIGAVVSSAGTDDAIGESIGPSSAIGGDFRVEPGQTIDVPVTFGTDDCRADADYAVPAGDYDVVAYSPGFGRSQVAHLTVIAK